VALARGLEGNLIAPAMVAQIYALKDNEENQRGYDICKGLTIREEISTALRVGQSHFDASAKLHNPSVEATRRFVRGLLAETFGFDDLAPADGVVSFLDGGRVPIVVVPPADESLTGAARRFRPIVRGPRLSHFRIISTTTSVRCGAW
jgi:hypothetical protein